MRKSTRHTILFSLLLLMFSVVSGFKADQHQRMTNQITPATNLIKETVVR